MTTVRPMPPPVIVALETTKLFAAVQAGTSASEDGMVVQGRELSEPERCAYTAALNTLRMFTSGEHGFLDATEQSVADTLPEGTPQYGLDGSLICELCGESEADCQCVYVTVETGAPETEAGGDDPDDDDPDEDPDDDESEDGRGDREDIRPRTEDADQPDPAHETGAPTSRGGSYEQGLRDPGSRGFSGTRIGVGRCELCGESTGIIRVDTRSGGRYACVDCFGRRVSSASTDSSDRSPRQDEHAGVEAERQTRHDGREHRRGHRGRP